jgi:hypothetical protein
MVKTSKNGLVLLLGVCLVSLIAFLMVYEVPPWKVFQGPPVQVTIPQGPLQPVTITERQGPQGPMDIQVIVAQDYTDTLKNVYAPPIRYRELDYRQLGYLTAPGRERLPLFGRVLNRRDKWTYYTLEQGIKLPIEYNKRLCTQSPGCDELSSGDLVKVEGSAYKVNLYESFLVSY